MALACKWPLAPGWLFLLVWLCEVILIAYSLLLGFTMHQLLFDQILSLTKLKLRSKFRPFISSFYNYSLLTQQKIYGRSTTQWLLLYYYHLTKKVVSYLPHFSASWVFYFKVFYYLLCKCKLSIEFIVILKIKVLHYFKIKS